MNFFYAFIILKAKFPYIKGVKQNMKKNNRKPRTAAVLTALSLTALGLGAITVNAEVLSTSVFSGDGQPAEEGPLAGDGQLGADGQLKAPEGTPSTDDDSLEAQGQIGAPHSDSSSTFSKSNEIGSAFPDLMEQIQANLPQGNGTWACYVCNLADGGEDSFGNARMQSASLIKLYIMGAVYEDKRYESLVSTYGEAKLNSLLNPMITVSSNEAANTLISYLGGGDSTVGISVVNSFAEGHGYTSTHMGRLLMAPNDKDDNYTSVEDCGKFLKEIYEGAAGKETKLSHCKEMFDLLKQQTCVNKIPAQMPAGVKVANKTGELGNVENDAGIVYDTGKNDLVIVFMSENLTAVGYAQTAIAANSAAIYKYFNK